MLVLEKIARSIGNSEFVSRKRKKYQEDADYRYQLQENLVYGTLVAGSVALFLGGIIYLANQEPAYAVALTEITKPDGDGLHITADILENLAFTDEGQYFETPQGMFLVEFYGELEKLF
jgi:hypothetical protein